MHLRQRRRRHGFGFKRLEQRLGRATAELIPHHFQHRVARRRRHLILQLTQPSRVRLRHAAGGGRELSSLDVQSSVRAAHRVQPLRVPIVRAALASPRLAFRELIVHHHRRHRRRRVRRARRPSRERRRVALVLFDRRRRAERRQRDRRRDASRAPRHRDRASRAPRAPSSSSSRRRARLTRRRRRRVVAPPPRDLSPRPRASSARTSSTGSPRRRARRRARARRGARACAARSARGSVRRA